MRYASALLAVVVIGCSDDPTEAGNTDVTMSVATGGLTHYFYGFPGTVSVTNHTAETATIRSIDCGNQVEKQNGSGWISYASSSSICNFVGIPADQTVDFTFNIPGAGAEGTYRVVSVVRKGEVETSIHSETFNVGEAPICSELVKQPCRAS